MTGCGKMLHWARDFSRLSPASLVSFPSQEEFVSDNRVSKKITFGWAETLVGRTHHKGNCWYERLCVGVYVCTGFNPDGTSCLFKEAPTRAKEKMGEK
jgi:hypothetical protein